MDANAMNKMVETADTMRRWVTAAGTLEEAVAACEKVALVLETTMGLWQAARYAYKGREIATHAAAKLIDMRLAASAERRTKRAVARRDAAHRVWSRLEQIRIDFRQAEKEWLESSTR